ncbi:hypothetical protein Q5752_004936 [Cryptotrichosporon argae]
MAPTTPPPPSPFSDILRGSETATASAPCRFRSHAGRVDADVVVVGHAADGSIEHAVLVVARQPVPAVLCALAVTPALTHALTQVPPSPSTSFFAQSSKPHLDLVLTSGGRAVELQIQAQHTARVQALTRELRRAVDASSTSLWSHAWLAYYAQDKDDPHKAMSVVTLTPSGSASSLDRAFDEAPADEAGDDAQPNPFAEGFSRTTFMRARLKAREAKWASTKQLKIRLSTYNVNDRIPPLGTKELAPLVGDDDVLVLGLQEADLRSSAMLVSQGSERADAWEKAMLDALGERSGEYEKIAAVQYVGVLMVVLVRSALREHISRIDTASRGIGLLGFGGNKAGVAVRFKVYDTTICIVNSHLAAFANQLERRRSDYAALVAGLVFLTPQGVNMAIEPCVPETGPVTVDHSDVTFWLGDLNYRLDMDDADARALAEQRDWEKLVAADQLLADIATGKSFAGYTEPDITFAPSFKYVHGSTTFDPKRPPAYTDRVIHLSRGPTIAPRSYASHDILWSDHLPVSAAFDVGVRVADDAGRAAELAVVQSELDKLEEIWRPSLGVTDAVEFGEVGLRQAVVREVHLRNDGRVPATFSFRAPSASRPICKHWFWPVPAAGTVWPGSSMSLRVTLFVTEADSLKLSAGGEVNDVLVLQVHEGKDTFVTLRATYLPSIIGVPLEAIPTLPVPIRELSVHDRKQLLAAGKTPVPTPVATPAATPMVEADDAMLAELNLRGANGAEASQPPVEGQQDGGEDDEVVTTEPSPPAPTTKPPREVWRLLERLMEHGARVEALWTGQAEVGDVLGVIEALDTGSELAAEPCAVAAALVYLLANLPTPLVPPSHVNSCIAAVDRDEAYAVLEGMPGVHTNVLIGLVSVVRLCLGAKPCDDATAEVLANAVFGHQEAKGTAYVRALLEG